MHTDPKLVGRHTTHSTRHNTQHTLLQLTQQTKTTRNTRLLCPRTHSGFDEPLPFSFSDVGPTGGIQEWVSDAEVEYYIPDRIKRYTGDASADDPWPTHE